MGLGIGTLITGAWRANSHAAGHVEVIPSNYGHTGSYADYRRRRFDTVLAPLSGSDPRLPRYNGLVATVFRLRVTDDAKVAAVAARAPRPFGAPVQFSQPRTASLAGRTTVNGGSGK